MVKNPVMFVTWVGALFTTCIVLHGLFTGRFSSFECQIALWLWFTVLFANFAEALAEGRGKAQAEALKKGRIKLIARLMVDGVEQEVAATSLRVGDIVVCEANDTIPGRWRSDRRDRQY